MTLSGHVWTLYGYLRRLLVRPPVAPATEWATEVDDPDIGTVRLTGLLSEIRSAPALVVLVHGLGGCVDSSYMVEAAAAALQAGFSSLRLNLRGADRLGEDIYHAGLTADIECTLAKPEVRAYDSILLLGFSMGGHAALRLAVDGPPGNLRAVAAVCAPLDLTATALRTDQRRLWIYRRYLLSELWQIYSAVVRRQSNGFTDGVPLRPKTFVEFDGAVIAPRFGFRDARDYYARASVGPLLPKLRLPALLLAAVNDPLVPVASLRPFVERASPALDVCWIERGGHLAFPAALDLGFGPAPGLYSQVLGWLGSRL